MGKGIRASHNMEPSHRPEAVGHVIHMDLIGPIETPTLGGKRYIMLTTDGFSGYRHLYLLKTKDETTAKLATFFAEFEVGSGQRPKLLYSDCGSEFENQRNQALFGLEHVQLITSAPYTPQQNGAAERSNRTIIETCRTQVAQQGLHPGLWGEAVMMAKVIRNCIPCRGKTITPFED